LRVSEITVGLIMILFVIRHYCIHVIMLCFLCFRWTLEQNESPSSNGIIAFCCQITKYVFIVLSTEKKWYNENIINTI
jgi:hypothetical protein